MTKSYQLSKKDKTYVDLSLAFVPSALNNDITVLTNERAINNAIKNIIFTIPLEQPFNRNFGSKVTDYLFDGADQSSAGLLYLEIERSINFCEPRVELQDIKVDADSFHLDANAIEVTVVYKIIGSEKLFEIREILIPTR